MRINTAVVWRALALALLLLAGASAATAQELVEQVLISFPAGTSRVEYARPAELRKLAEYPQLREQFVGPRLREMHAALEKLGIPENDIDEVALGWTPRESAPAKPATSESYVVPTRLSGLLAGRFDPNRIAESAAANELTAIEIKGLKAYCLKGEVPACLVAINESLAAFGEPEGLTELLEVREGAQGSLGTDRRFTRLIHNVDRHAAIWGIATDDTVPEWFRGWLPGEGQNSVDWLKILKRVDDFTYSVSVKEQIELTAKLGAESGEVASQLEQLFTGLRSLLAILWQTQQPQRPNPLAGMTVVAEGRVCVLKVGASLKDALAYQNFPMRAPGPPATVDAKTPSAP